MKTSNIKTIAFCSFMALAAASCKKSSTTTTTTPPVTTAFTFKVDGAAAITVDSATAVLYNLTTGARYMDVYAYKGGAEVLEFHFVPQTGSQSVTNVLGGTSLTYLESAVSSYDAQSGTLNITTCDTTGNKIVGDFNFVGKVYPYTGTTTHTITEGHMIVSKIIK